LLNKYYEYSLVLGEQEGFNRATKKRVAYIKYWTIEIPAPPCAFAAPPPTKVHALGTADCQVGEAKKGLDP
jgi:hypothetical protein